jgi:DNA primase
MNWTNILLECGLQIPVDRAEISMVCPLHGDRVSSLSINTDKGVWICFAGCGQGSLKSFLGKYLNLSALEVDKYLSDKEVSLDLNFFDEFSLDDDVIEIGLPEDFIINEYPEWIFDRGFTKQTLSEWQCGINKYNDLIIPIYDLASLKGWVARRLNAVPKYMYSKGFKKSKHLFGIEHITRSPFICVTEGSLDTVWLQQNGYPSVAILGAIVSKAQEELLAKLPAEELVICLDNDSAGQQGKERLMGCMTQNFVVSYINLPKEYKDIQDVRDRRILQEIIENRDIW